MKTAKSMLSVVLSLLLTCLVLLPALPAKANAAGIAEQGDGWVFYDDGRLVVTGNDVFNEENTLPDAVVNGALRCELGPDVTGFQFYYLMPQLQAFAVDPANERLSADDAGVLFSKDGTRLIAYPTAREEEIYNVPAGTVYIETDAFRNTLYLKEPVFVNPVKLDRRAFTNAGIETIRLPEGSTFVNQFPFSEMNNLLTLSLPASVLESCYYELDRKIPFYATFYNCAIYDLYLGEGFEEVEYGPFYLTAVEALHLPGTLKKITVNAYPGLIYRTRGSVNSFFWNGTPEDFPEVYIPTAYHFTDNQKDNEPVDPSDLAVHYGTDSHSFVTLSEKDETATCVKQGYFAEFESCEICTYTPHLFFLYTDSEIADVEMRTSRMKEIEQRVYEIQERLEEINDPTDEEYIALLEEELTLIYVDVYGGRWYKAYGPHSLTEVPAAPASCAAEGTLAHWHCDVCGKNFEEETAEHELADVSVPKTAHAWDNGALTVAPTCTATGEITFTCTVCGAEKSEPLPKLDHKDDDRDGYCDFGCGTRMGEPAGKDNACPWCGEVHTGFVGWWVALIHHLLFVFARIFGAR